MKKSKQEHPPRWDDDDLAKTINLVKSQYTPHHVYFTLGQYQQEYISIHIQHGDYPHEKHIYYYYTIKLKANSHHKKEKIQSVGHRSIIIHNATITHHFIIIINQFDLDDDNYYRWSDRSGSGPSHVKNKDVSGRGGMEGTFSSWITGICIGILRE